MARVCMFCGGRPLTSEHVFGEWLKRSIPVELARLEVRNEFETPLWTLYSFDIEARVVCGPCNWGWMSKLEDVCKPLLKDAILFGSEVNLSADQQRSVAMWAVKTAMVLEGYRGDAFQFLPERHARWMPTHADPPPDTTVWAFVRPMPFAERSIPEFTVMRSFGFLTKDPPNQAKGYVSTFVIGYMGFHVFGSDPLVEGSKPGVQLGSYWNDAILPIWPSGGTISWPPLRALSREEITRLSRWGRTVDPLP